MTKEQLELLKSEEEKVSNSWNYEIYQGVWNSNGTYDSTTLIRCRTNPITDFSVINKGKPYIAKCLNNSCMMSVVAFDSNNNMVYSHPYSNTVVFVLPSSVMVT